MLGRGEQNQRPIAKQKIPRILRMETHRLSGCIRFLDHRDPIHHGRLRTVQLGLADQLAVAVGVDDGRFAQFARPRIELLDSIVIFRVEIAEHDAIRPRNIDHADSAGDSRRVRDVEFPVLALELFHAAHS